MSISGKNKATPEQLQQIQNYIKNSWVTLERNHSEMLDAMIDVKVIQPDVKPVLYVSQKEDLASVKARLETVTQPGELDEIEVRHLPETLGEIKHHGLLYLPNHYIVPGGSFNEMYGWDSYFIILGLLRDGDVSFAREMADNLLYQVEMYGTVLNANRTYYLTRSQPPFLSEAVLAVFRCTCDYGWLRRSLPAIEKYYDFWTRGPRLIRKMKLSRYYDSGEGPAPEVLVHERDVKGETHFDRVKRYYREQGDGLTEYELPLYYDRATDSLTPLFYKADRAMRESGHDPSNRFGFFNIGVLNMLPVDLNCLLYRMEIDLAEIEMSLGNSPRASEWERQAADRARRINNLMWDEDHGLYFDYNYKQQQRRVYPYVTTFFPMWAGIASQEQAARIVENLSLFECRGGLRTSTNVSGNQWDAPMGWAPMHLIAVDGLRRYGYNSEADRITVNFLSMILKEFIEHGVILEKYNVENRESNVPAEITYGYTTNQVGFGWTNAAFVEMFSGLDEGLRDEVRWLVKQ